MKLLGALHLTILGSIVLLCFLVLRLCRVNPQLLQPVRRILGVALAVNESIWWIFRYAHECVHLVNLPLQLCDVAVLLAIGACFFQSRLLLEAAYFPGLAGATMALLTPDLYSPWPAYPAVYFFLAPGGIVIAVTTVVFGGRVTFPARAVWRALGMILIYAAVVGTFDRLSGANYMYLMRKPAAGSPLDAMGPWPWYVLSGVALALALFWLLWLPVRQRTIIRGVTSRSRSGRPWLR